MSNTTRERWAHAWDELQAYITSLPQDDNTRDIIAKMKQLRPKVSIAEMIDEHPKYNPDTDPAIQRFMDKLR